MLFCHSVSTVYVADQVGTRSEPHLAKTTHVKLEVDENYGLLLLQGNRFITWS